MKVKDGYILRHVMNSDVVMDVTGGFSGIIKLNEVSAEIWNGVAAGKSLAEIADDIAGKYEVGREQALADAEKFCHAMCEQGFFTE